MLYSYIPSPESRDFWFIDNPVLFFTNRGENKMVHKKTISMVSALGELACLGLLPGSVRSDHSIEKGKMKLSTTESLLQRRSPLSTAQFILDHRIASNTHKTYNSIHDKPVVNTTIWEMPPIFPSPRS